MINDFNENNMDKEINNDETPKFEFASAFEQPEENNNSSLVDEFNATDDNSFDFSSMVQDESIINDYDSEILDENNKEEIPYNENIFDGIKEKNDNQIELKYDGIKNNNDIETANTNEIKNDTFNEDIFNDIKNDTFNYEDATKYVENDESENDINDITFNDNIKEETEPVEMKDNDFIQFDTSIFDSIPDDSEQLNINYSDENTNDITVEEKEEIVDGNNTATDVSFGNEEDNNEKDKPVEPEKTKEEIYNEIDNSIKELDANTDFTIDDNKELTTDINNLFVKVNTNVQEASDIFSRNVEMKKILDNRFEELKQLQSEIESSRAANYEEINNYKEEVINKLTTKKEEVEEKLELLKKLQSEFEQEKNEFENYKKDEIVKIEKMRKEEETTFEERRNELNRIEDKLRKQKDFLEEEKRQLSLDQIKYETDKNELANNMIKFNEIVGKFTSGIDGIN